ncbi:MAG: hypothetical protein JSV32_03550 [Dehalococcoidia bacterium]|nr:MAG: hypothetical protein JSV32_03550 [Dehalococcoidia bacterium]
MKNPVLIILILFFTLLVCSITVSCTIKNTVTVDKTFTILENPIKAVEIQPVRLTVTVIKTITTTIEGIATTVTLEPTVFTPIFDRPVPDIPHVYIIEMEHTGADWYEDEGGSICWVCHNIPFEHELWIENTEICEDCHIVVDNPVLTYSD